MFVDGSGFCGAKRGCWTSDAGFADEGGNRVEIEIVSGRRADGTADGRC